MQNPVNRQVRSKAVAQAAGFNYNKLQAAFCIASSSIVSLAVIIWACKNLF